jgi:hypothetical protein
MMSISFDSDEIVLEKLRKRLRRMTDEELIRFGKDVRRLAENPFQKQLEEARAEWKRRKRQQKCPSGLVVLSVAGLAARGSDDIRKPIRDKQIVAIFFA